MEWVPPVVNAVAELGWMTDRDGRLVQRYVLDFALRAFTQLWKSSSAIGEEALRPFITWIKALPDDAVVAFCWDLLANDRSVTPIRYRGCITPDVWPDRFPMTI